MWILSGVPVSFLSLGYRASCKNIVYIVDSIYHLGLKAHGEHSAFSTHWTLINWFKHVFLNPLWHDPCLWMIIYSLRNLCLMKPEVTIFGHEGGALLGLSLHWIRLKPQRHRVTETYQSQGNHALKRTPCNFADPISCFSGCYSDWGGDISSYSWLLSNSLLNSSLFTVRHQLRFPPFCFYQGESPIYFLF